MIENRLSSFPGTSRTRLAERLFFSAGLLVALVGIFWIYRLGFSGPWTFDAHTSLVGLENVTDLSSALTYVLGNRTGPTGRPLSIISFLANLKDWPQNPAGFRQINTLIHLTNVLLVVAVTWRVAKNIPSLAGRSLSLAVALGLAWGLHPLLASTVLAVVQRMALLSAFFVLLGILGYLVGRERLPATPAQGIAIILLSLGACTLLGALAKENAVLLLAFIGVMELTILSRYRPIELPYWSWLAYLLLWGSILLFAAYIVYSWSGISMAQTYSYRPFDWTQRLWSEMLILWEYVRQVLVPDIRAMGPMQDDTTRIHGLDLGTFLATMAWVGVLFASFALRKRNPLFLFGIGFFLVGHLIESTFVQLELYFEHRNYIASLGLLAIPVSLAWLSPKSWPRLAVYFGVIPVFGLLLFLTARGWGDPVLSSERWYQAHPTSWRAIRYRTSVMEHFEGLPVAAGFTASASDQQPDNLNVAAFALLYQCKANERFNGMVALNRIERLITTPYPLRDAWGFLGLIDEIRLEQMDGGCPWLPYERVMEILRAIDQDPILRRHPFDLARHHWTLGLYQLKTGHLVDALNSLHQGFLLHRNYQAFGLYTGILRGLGLTAEAEMIRDQFLANPLRDVFSMEEHRRRALEAYSSTNIRINWGPTIGPLLRDFTPPEMLPLGMTPAFPNAGSATSDAIAITDPQ
jgi:hypothetical protein